MSAPKHVEPFTTGKPDGRQAPNCRHRVPMRCCVGETLFAFGALAIGAAPVDRPRTYLLSIGRIPLRDTETVEAFSFETWGVQFRSVCGIPSGWRIKAGSSATPNGTFEGEGSQGATWFKTGSPRELRDFILVTLYAPVQRAAITSGTGVVPATFKGTATSNIDDGHVKPSLLAIETLASDPLVAVRLGRPQSPNCRH